MMQESLHVDDYRFRKDHCHRNKPSEKSGTPLTQRLDDSHKYGKENIPIASSAIYEIVVNDDSAMQCASPHSVLDIE